MDKDSSQYWTAFFKNEKALLDYVNHNCELLDVVPGCEPRYQIFSEYEGLQKTKAPAYIRCVAVLPDDGIEFSQLYHVMVESLLNARAENNQKSKRLPTRFPVRYDNVECITTRRNRAIKSFSLVPHDKVVLNKTIVFEAGGHQSIIDEYQAHVSVFKKHGFKTASVAQHLTSTHFGSAPTISLTVDTDELFEKFNTDHIQARVETGFQYRATLRKEGQTRGEQVNYGFIVLDKNSRPDIFIASPQQPRANRLENTAKQIDLPIVTETSLYIKE
jgi:hypothetical protein